LDETFAEPRAGFIAVFGLTFFFPLALSRCSFCFSFASVVSPEATFLTSTSFNGRESASSVMFREEGVERFRLVGLEEQINELVGELDEIFFCSRLEGQQGC
jgi:hypothetical protein